MSQQHLRPYLVSILLFWLLISGLLVVFRAAQDDQHKFTGFYGSRFHKWVAYDSALYLDMIEQSRRGAWLFENRFSPERSNHPRYMNSYWLFAGKFARLTGLSALTVFTLLRFVSIAFFIFALRRLLIEVVAQNRTRNLALLLILFCGGVGWIFGILGHWLPHLKPLYTEGRSPEVSCFLSLLVSPHITTAMGFVLLILTGFIASSRNSHRARLITPVLMLALATFHPYDIATTYAIGAFYAGLFLLRDGRLNKGLTVTYGLSLLLSLPVIAYHKWALSSAPDLAGLKYQNALPPESSLQYMFALFPLGILALHQLAVTIADFKHENEGQLLITTWAIAIPTMVYAYPLIPFAWKMGVAMPVPIYILAAEWIEQRMIRERIEQSFVLTVDILRLRIAIAAVVAIALCSSVATLGAMARAAFAHAHPYYVEQDDLQAMRWLAKQKGCDDAVLSCRWEGAFMPRMAGKRAFMGHVIQSVKYGEKERFTSSLFRNGSLQKRELAKLQDLHVKWVYYGVSEQKRWKKLRASEQLHPVYSNGRVTIYEINYGDRSEGHTSQISICAWH